jgi:hypothetical protein
LEKIIKKIIWENTATIHSVLKKKNYKVKFLINSTLKKNKSRDNFRNNNNNNNKHKKRKKNHVGNTITIHSVL